MKRLLPMLFGGIFFMMAELQAQSIDSLMGVYDTKVPIEKIYIHFDNSLYVPGQTVWYKAYILKGSEPSDLSKNLYLSWFDEQGKLIERSVAPVIGSCASGSFTVPQKYTATGIQVLAYTQWMLNFDSAFLFHKTILVQPAFALKSEQQPVEELITLRFFPEGGDMIDNIPCTIAFKAQKQGGMPAEVNGIIKDKSGKAIIRFVSVHDGMGKISLTPLPGEVYTAEWIDTFGKKHYTRLPSAKTDGIILSVNNNLKEPVFSIERNINAGERFKKGSIVAHINQRVIFRAGLDFGLKTKITASIPITDLPSGVLQVTVFDALHNPIAERILFLNNNNYSLAVDVHTDTLNLTNRGKNTFEIDVPDSVGTSLSLSVIDEDTGTDSSTNIISQILLSGEIKGNVYRPAYYFSSFSDTIKEHLDLVMLTNGWRRFRWEDVWNGNIPPLIYQPDTNYLFVGGRIDSLSEHKITKASTVNMILQAKDSSRQIVFTPLHADGSFGENNLIFFDTTKIFYQLNRVSLPGKSHIKIRTSFLPFDSTIQIPALQPVMSDSKSRARMEFIISQQRRLDSLKNKTTLEEVIVRTKYKTTLEQLNDKYTSSSFSAHAGHIYELDVLNDPASTNGSIFQYIKDKVPGLQMLTDRRGKNVLVFGGKWVSALFIDEQPVDLDVFAALSIRQIAFIKMFRTFYHTTLRGRFIDGLPALAVYTKKGKDANVLFGTPLQSVSIPGYTPVKEFYVPDNSEQFFNSQLIDLRRTIYWKSDIRTGGNNNKVKVSFYNNDISRSLRIVVEGMAQDGRLIHFSKLLN